MLLRALFLVLSLALFLGLPAPALALILDAGDGSGNTAPPEDDPGWNNVGQHLGSPSVVYLGNGWILTAAHVGPSIVTFGEQRFDPIAGSPTQLTNSDGSQADLLLFRIDGDPNLPELSIATSSAKVGQEVLLVAVGSSRSKRVSISTEEQGMVDGFRWKAGQTKRWGTNIIEGEPTLVEQEDVQTMALPIVFDRIESAAGTRQEAVAAKGDSGGAVFARSDPLEPDSPWTLAGLLFSVASPSDHPSNSSFYGDVTWVADLSKYRNQILALVYPGGGGASRANSEASESGSSSLPQSVSTLVLWAVVGFAIWKVFQASRQSDR
jgi:hypothetical protein